MADKIDGRILDALRGIAGPENVLIGADEREPYTHDEEPGLQAWPAAVVRAGTTAEVGRILALASRESIFVTCRGGGTGLSGGAVPVRGGIVLSLERMNRIIEIDRENLMAVVEPGVITGDLHRAVEAEGLFYPPDPASLDTCTIGGNLATGAGGPRAVKYGTTRDYVCGLEAVLPSGDVIACGGKLVKNSTGYNLAQLLVGSEGTLAVITGVTLRLLPLPAARIDLLVPFPDLDSAARTVSDIIRERLVPTTIEFMDRESILACERLMEKELPFHDAAAHLLIQLDGESREAAEADGARVGALCEQNGAPDVLVAQDRPARDRLWEARRLLLEAVKNESAVIHMEDLVVPRAAIPALVRGVRELSARHGVRCIAYGHAGDGNVHVNMLKAQLSDAQWAAAVPALESDLFELALSLGGMISGEHGIGFTRRDHLERTLGPEQVRLMERIRAAFDPNGILNPGKIFPDQERNGP
jgi:glycolate oxidase